MNDLIVIQDRCQSCGVDFRGPANFCGNCGVSVAAAQEADYAVSHVAPEGTSDVPHVVVIAPTSQVSIVEQALRNRMMVVAILLFAGPIGLPALWFSPSFSRRVKFITTSVYFLLTAILPLVAAWYLLEVAMRPLVNVFNG